MNSVFIVVGRLRSNHIRVVAAFKSRVLAETYRLHMLRGEHEFKTFLVFEVPVLDGTPEMNRIMLGFPEGNEAAV